MRPLVARRQHNSPILYIGVQRITCPNIESAAKRAWKNDLSLRGNFGLHGKTILPLSFPCGQPRLTFTVVINGIPRRSDINAFQRGDDPDRVGSIWGEMCSGDDTVVLRVLQNFRQTVEGR
jgi:hypothetical protein